MIESGSVRRALSRVRDEISPTRDDKARLRARILAPAVPLAPESAGHDATAPARVARLTPWAALKAAGSVGAAAGLALLGLGGGMGFWLGHEVAISRTPGAAAFERPAAAVEAPLRELERSAVGPPASTTPTAPSEPVADVAATSAAASAEASEARREPHPSDVPSRAHTVQRRAQPNPLDAELALLRRVERALRSDDPPLARALLGELDERFPDSRFPARGRALGGAPHRRLSFG